MKETDSSDEQATPDQGREQPLLHVFLLGHMRLDWHVAPAEPEAAWKGRQSARDLFLLLLCFPERQASRIQVASILWPETEESKALESLRSALKVLRRVLCSADGEVLIETPTSSLLKLADQTRLWVDVDAFLNVVEQASQQTDVEQALSRWQQARLLLSGEFLEGEQTREWRRSRWARLRHQALYAARRRMVYHLAKLLIENGQRTQAEEVLSNHVTRFPADQDALFLLMKLLIEEERFEEAHWRYEEGKLALKALGKQSAKYLRTLDEQVSTIHLSMIAKSEQKHLLATHPHFLSGHTSGIIDAKLETDSSLEQKEFLPSVLTTGIHPPEEERGDWSLWFGLKVGQLITTIDHWQGCISSSDQLQAMLDQEIMLFDAMKPSQHHGDYMLSRRQALVTIAMLPTAQCTSLLQGLSSNSFVEKCLTRCAASITVCWHLLKGSELELVEQTLSTYLFALVTLAQQPTPHRKTAAKLACQAYRLWGIVALHRNNLKARENYCQQALYFSEIAENPSLLVSAQISLASTFYYNKKPVPAAHMYQKALLHEREIPPLQRSRIYAELAVVSAQQKQEQEALRILGYAQQRYPDHPENDPSFLYADFSPASLILEEGLTYLALAQHYPERNYKQQAWNSFSRVDTLAAIRMVPERIYFEIVNHQAAVALIQRDLEQLKNCLEKGIKGAYLLQSKQRFQEAAEVYSHARTIWPHETRLKKLEEVFNTWRV